MNKENFIKYMANRYGIDEAEACGITHFFADCLQELITSGISVDIDEIGQFISSPLFPKDLQVNHPTLQKLATTKIVNFKPSKQLTISN